MNWKATWMGQQRWFATETDAAAWAVEQVRRWLVGGARSPLYRVVYNPSGTITQTFGGV